MIIKTFVIGEMANNNFLLIDNNEAVLIDCTGTIAELGAVLTEYEAKLKYILLTHAHFDHIAGVAELQKKYPDVKVGIHKDEKENLEKTDEFLKEYGLPQIDVPSVDFYFKEGDTIKFGNEKLKVLDLPGHTSGGAGFVSDEGVFSGDTIFLESMGRTDLPTGSLDAIRNSIKTKLFTLDDNTILYTGHGAQTSVGYEKKYNSYV